MHPCPGYWVGIGRAVVYYARGSHTFSARIKCRHCTDADLVLFFSLVSCPGLNIKVKEQSRMLLRAKLVLNKCPTAFPAFCCDFLPTYKR